MLGFDALGRLAIGQPPGTSAGATIFEDSWHQPFIDRVRRLPPYAASRQQFAAYVQFAPFNEQWTQERFTYVALSQPVQPRKPRLTGLPPSSQQFAAFVQFAPFNELVSADRWFVPFSEPTRYRRRLATANQWFGRGIEFPLTTSIRQLSVLLLGTATLSGVPTSNYKMILDPVNRRKLIYAAEISPWTLSQ